MGIIKYKFKKFWEVEDEILLNNNPTCLLCLNTNIVLFSEGNILKLYKYNKNNYFNFLNINAHEKEITDILKIKENTFISSSKDKTISFIQLIDDYTKYNILKKFDIHHDEINQVIKLKGEHLYASCAKDESIKIWYFNYLDAKSNVLVNYSFYHDDEITSICEFQESNIVSISTDGLLIFWQLIYDAYEKMHLMKGFFGGLHNCLFLFREKILLVSTKYDVLFIDIILKEIINRYSLNYNAYSICYSEKNIFLGLKDSDNSCLLFEYNYEDKEYEKIYFECVGKGRDNCAKITFINVMNENTIVTCNKNNLIKFWKQTEKKPQTLLSGHNPDYYYEEEEEYQNVKDFKIGETPKGLDDSQIYQGKDKGKENIKIEKNFEKEIKINNMDSIYSNNKNEIIFKPKEENLKPNEKNIKKINESIMIENLDLNRTFTKENNNILENDLNLFPNKSVQIVNHQEQQPTTLKMNQSQLENSQDNFLLNNLEEFPNLGMNPMMMTGMGLNMMYPNNNCYSYQLNNTQRNMMMNPMKMSQTNLLNMSQSTIQQFKGELQMVNKEENLNSIQFKGDNSKIDVRFQILCPDETLVLSCERDITVEKLIQLFFEKYNHNKNQNKNINFLCWGKILKINDKTKLNDLARNQKYITILVLSFNTNSNNNCNISVESENGTKYEISIPYKENMNNLLKKYFEKIGKPFQENNFEFLKDINFGDFLIALSDSNH